MTKTLYKAVLLSDPSVVNWPTEDQIGAVLLSLHGDDEKAAANALRTLNESGVYRHNDHDISRRVEMELPFPGFYESALSGEFDHVEELLAEREAGERPGLEPSDISDALYWAIDNSNAEREIARDYADAFRDQLESEHEITLDLVYAGMESPKQYNFSTDKLFVHLPMWQLAMMRAEVDDEVFAKVIRERHTSRSGFISFYSNKLAEWDAKPLHQWDHNEARTLLEAYLETKNVDMEKLESRVIEDLQEHNKFDAAIDAAIDNEVLEAKLKEKLENDDAEADG